MTLAATCWRGPEAPVPTFLRACWARLWSTAALSVGLLGVIAAEAAPRTAWHHGRSRYRAELELVSEPNHAGGGYAVVVPHCGLGREGGGDFYAFDDGGRVLPILPLGEDGGNSALAVVLLRTRTKRIYVYFGSKGRAQVNERLFLNTLTVEVRTLPPGPATSWKQVEGLLERSKPLGRRFVEQIAQSYNPVDSSDECILVFDGCLNVDRRGSETLMLVSDDAGYLFADDTLIVERNGRHSAHDATMGQSRGTVKLRGDPVPIRCVVVDFGGDLMAVVARWKTQRDKHTLGARDFVQAGKTKLLVLEARYNTDGLPAFWTKHKSYMRFEESDYTEVEFGTFNGREATWRFSDGARFEAETFTRVIPGLSTLTVKVTERRVSTTAKVPFPELPPQRRMIGSKGDFDQYSAFIKGEDASALETDALEAYTAFLNHREFNADVLPFCAALGERDRTSARSKRNALLTYARIASRTEARNARRAYAYLFDHDRGNSKWGNVALEYVEFLLFRQGDIEKAQRLVEATSRHLSRRDPRPYVMAVDVSLQMGDAEEAVKHLGKLLGARDVGRRQRYIAVQSNALQDAFYDHLDRDEVFSAWDVMHRWSLLTPHDRLDGDLPLARARLWRRLGWLSGAMRELTGSILLNPLLPNLPDVELEQAIVLTAQGKEAEAMAQLEKIAGEYPNHPAGEQARRLMK